MSTSITNAFVQQYESEVHDIFQREGGMLRPTARSKDNIVGTSTTFQKIGKGTATTKARHGVITPMNQDHTAVACTLEDYYAGDWVDKLDEAKTNTDERMAIARGGAYALGRKVDDQIFVALDSTTESTVTWAVGSANAVRNSLLKMSEALDGNDVPNDGLRFGALTPRGWAHAMTVKEFSNSDYIGANGLPFKEGAGGHRKFKDWMGIKWCMHSAVPGKGTSSAKPMVWHKNAVGFASAKSAGNVASNEGVSADITWHGDRAAHFVNHMMSGGSCLIDGTGVIEGALDDTTELATS